MTKRSPLALAVLVLLYEEPMHVYRMQQLIQERGKDEVINVTQRNSLYQMIARLERDGLIVVRNTGSENNRPEKVVYKITHAGRGLAVEWTRQILSTPSREFPDFPAAVSVLPVLTPEDALEQFEKRIVALEAEAHRIRTTLKEASFVPRLFLLEMEYLQGQVNAEMKWVRAVIADLKEGRLTWNDQWIRETAESLRKQPASKGVQR